ncbi:MAG: hypothetical protein ACI9V1_000626 [Spirosomataceae bacterium]|jgi:hypothetical protein
MKLMFTLLLFLTFGALKAQKAKILAGDKVEYDKMSK